MFQIYKSKSAYEYPLYDVSRRDFRIFRADDLRVYHCIPPNLPPCIYGVLITASRFRQAFRHSVVASLADRLQH